MPEMSESPAIQLQLFTRDYGCIGFFCHIEAHKNLGRKSQPQLTSAQFIDVQILYRAFLPSYEQLSRICDRLLIRQRTAANIESVCDR